MQGFCSACERVVQTYCCYSVDFKVTDITSNEGNRYDNGMPLCVVQISLVIRVHSGVNLHCVYTGMEAQLNVHRLTEVYP